MSLQTTYVGQAKLIVYDGRYYAHCDEAAGHVNQAQWARTVLSAPCVNYENGRESHEVANEVLERSEAALIDFLRVLA